MWRLWEHPSEHGHSLVPGGVIHPRIQVLLSPPQPGQATTVAPAGRRHEPRTSLMHLGGNPAHLAMRCGNGTRGASERAPLPTLECNCAYGCPHALLTVAGGATTTRVCGARHTTTTYSFMRSISRRFDGEDMCRVAPPGGADRRGSATPPLLLHRAARASPPPACRMSRRRGEQQDDGLSARC